MVFESSKCNELLYNNLLQIIGHYKRGGQPAAPFRHFRVSPHPSNSPQEPFQIIITCGAGRERSKSIFFLQLRNLNKKTYTKVSGRLKIQ